MANLLQVENLTKSFGVNSLFDDINFTINEGDKVGLIAKNGTGKSTLLSIIAGDDTPDDGKLIFKNDVTIGYLKQLPQFEPHLSVMDTCLIGDDDQSKAIRQYENALIEGNNEEMTKAIQAMDLASAWDYEERFKQILSQLKIDDFKQRISELSGGQIKRVALAKILISNPQFLILDEPTNHLDIDMIEWLEAYLSRSRMTILMVTHDRYFLDKICSKILELDQKSIFGYDGNYNYYLEKRAERIDAQNAAVEKARNLLRTEIEWMRRQPQARAHKAQYRIDAFYDLKERAQSRNDKGDVELNVKAGYIGKKIFVAHHVSKSFDGKVILNDFNYIFSRYEKLGIVGDNGVGKSTFIKLLLDRIQPDSGYFEIGETVKFGYYSQEGIHFDEGKKVIDAIRDVAEHIYFDEKHHYSASQLLQLFLFSPTDQQKLIEKLSGGEKRRLYLAMVLMSKPNFLILDEPTNDLDIQTLEILEDYLSKFSGCLIVISHDRFFMDRCVDHTFVFMGDGVIKDFPGNYSEYRAWKEAHEKEEATAQKQKAESKPVKPRSNNRDNSQKLTFKEKREFEELTESIDRLTKEKEELFNLFNSGEQIDDVATKASRFEEVKDLLDEMELRWLELSEKNS
ncbi:MAG: ABC-F family ATP-binding cassette domain-containing protein [Sodaliphilus sp.]|nr:ABC-F family ATP-binding cassette domain-containing protein [Bacteroidales bacterium]MDY5537701.1 ABC-F family ATP-binding cassette domain-containing protein [Sodaliphilus sp.]